MNSLITIEKTKADEEKFMNEIITTRGACLPDKIEDIINIFEFTDLKAKAFKMLSDKIKKVDDQADIYQSAQRSAQKWSITSLYAMKKLGELTQDIPADKQPRKINKHLVNDRNGGVNKSAFIMNQDGPKSGIPTATWRDAERIAKDKTNALERVIKRAEESETIEVPTKSAVLNTIKVEKQKEVNTRARVKGDAKIVNETTTATKDYYDQLKGFKTSIEMALKNAKVGKFAPEGKNFMIKKHNEIRDLLKQLEESL